VEATVAPSPLLTIDTPAGSVRAAGERFYVATHDLESPGKGERMTRLTRVLVLSGMVTLTTALGSVVGLPDQLLTAETGKPPVNHAVVANNDLALDLYAQATRGDAGKNVFFSPYSITNALVIVAEGARGKTADEMGKVLRFPRAARRVGGDAQAIPWKVSLIHTGLGELNRRLENSGKPPSKKVLDRLASLREALAESNDEVDKKGTFEAAARSRRLATEINKLQAQFSRYEVRVANGLWGEKTYPFRQAYLDTIGKHYGSAAFPVDFRNDPDGARKKINAWVEKQTRERIKDLVPKDAVDKSTKLVVANAVYFKGEWAEPFDAKETKVRPFFLAEGAVRVPTMYHDHLKAGRYAAFRKDGSFFATPQMVSVDGGDPKKLYPDRDGFEVLELPYKGDELSMVVLLPRSVDGLPALEKKLNSANLAAWTGKLRARPVNVLLPKFKLTAPFDLKKALVALGMKRAFRSPLLEDGAQFDGMTTARDPKDKLYISDALHKAFVEVSEKGTEAAAATALLLKSEEKKLLMVPFTPTFQADRAFVFMIRDRQTGSILFLGRVINPSKTE
jgi:serine protease inhibitor